MLSLLFLAGLALAAAQPNMSCATNGSPCAPPTWAPQWELVDSTICQPSADDFFQMPADKPWGLVRDRARVRLRPARVGAVEC